MKTKLDESNWSRYNLFQRFDDNVNPNAIITTEIDITNIYNYCKKNDISIYAGIGYFINGVVNKIDNFRIRREKDEFYLYDKVGIGYTENINDDTIGFFRVDMVDSLKEYAKVFEEKRNLMFTTDHNFRSGEKKYDEIWVSCQPWYHFTSLIPPFSKGSIPQFNWDKFKISEDKVTTNLMVCIHHGFADGSHIGKFINTLQEDINNFKGDE